MCFVKLKCIFSCNNWIVISFFPVIQCYPVDETMYQVDETVYAVDEIINSVAKIVQVKDIINPIYKK